VLESQPPNYPKYRLFHRELYFTERHLRTLISKYINHTISHLDLGYSHSVLANDTLFTVGTTTKEKKEKKSRDRQTPKNL